MNSIGGVGMTLVYCSFIVKLYSYNIAAMNLKIRISFLYTTFRHEFINVLDF